jgi:signal transduction histidine kinase
MRPALIEMPPTRRFKLRSDTRTASQGAHITAKPPALQALYAELAERDRELSRLRSQVNGLRYYTGGTDPAAVGERRPFELMAAVESALRATQTELAGVIVCQRMQLLQVFGSLPAIAQVLSHLFVNAAAAMRGTGRPGVLHIDAVRVGPRAQLRVSDNGCGVAPEAMRRIFEPFFSTGGPGLGLGLGLTVSRAIVRSHGGTLGCSNRTPHGARFTFDLPSGTVPEAAIRVRREAP